MIKTDSDLSLQKCQNYLIKLPYRYIEQQNEKLYTMKGVWPEVVDENEEDEFADDSVRFFTVFSLLNYFYFCNW